MLETILSACAVTRAPEVPDGPPTTIYDVTQLNPVSVSGVVVPTTTAEIANAIASRPGPVSIGGSRHSMGGQTAAAGAVQIDMRKFDRILSFDSLNRTITVQAGTRWRQIQERIDASNLSVKIMQSFSNFTVGGSLSVNAHGRYVGYGPLVSSVRSMKMVLADGRTVDVSREQNYGLFKGAIGGYGGLGVITEATLDLAENVNVKRAQRTMPIARYKEYFMRNIRDSTDVIFHNADIYPNDYTSVRAVSHVRTDDAVTESQRLKPLDESHRMERLALWIASQVPFGKALRQHVVDPWQMKAKRVVTRNYEASSDAAELDPASRKGSTYVLQEYFVPVERFSDFVSPMRAIFRRHHANVINVSIRHARPDTTTLLSWAPREVFAFVVYYKQSTDEESQREVGIWTREAIDAAINAGGSYYLPYQLHATQAQFERAYPHASEFFALKRKWDPTNKFRNMLWDKYMPRLP